MIAEVIVDVQNAAVDRVFDYIIPTHLPCEPGSRVQVSFGNRTIEGYILSIKETSDYPTEKLKPVLRVLDKLPPIMPEMLELSHFMKQAYHLKTVSVLRLFLPAQMRNGKIKEKTERIFVRNENINWDEERSLTKKQAKAQLDLIDFFEEFEQEKSAEILKQFSSSTVKALLSRKLIREEFVHITREPSFTKKENTSVVLTSMQQNVIDKVELNRKHTYLLHGVTGSGKTEVYLHLISSVLLQNKTAIMLVPEISLTPQMLSLFKARFGNQVAILHSSLSSGERFDEWMRIREGQAQIVLGARSAIFAPIQNLGMIIIDEEHEQSYISESDPRYNTHEVANFRANFHHCPIILGSATPSIPSYALAKSGVYQLLELPNRVNGKPLPSIQIVDMLNEIRDGNNHLLSRTLKNALDECVKNNKQAMLFLNRRGYTSFVMCKDCGYVAKCSDCDVSLVYHKIDEKLKCHFCGKRYKMLTNCPECKSANLRHGAIGTQQVVAEIKKLYPQVSVLRMDNDTTSVKNGHQEILSQFANAKPGILVGTQMIAKGHDFKDVTLVGIVDADQGLYQSDFRSSERTFALITQVAGRAGRAESDGKVVLQTYAPKHYVFKFAANYFYQAFFEKEYNLRKVTKFPPFTRIIRILASSEDEENVRQTVRLCYNDIKELRSTHADDFVFLDVMKSPVGKVKNKYRYQILMRIKEEAAEDLTQKVYKIADQYLANNLSLFVEINPQNLG